MQVGTDRVVLCVLCVFVLCCVCVVLCCVCVPDNTEWMECSVENPISPSIIGVAMATVRHTYW